MFFRLETEGQKLGKGGGFKTAVGTDHIYYKIISAELSLHLPANAAGRECTGDVAVLAAADSDGGKVSVAVVHRFVDGGALGTVGGALGSPVSCAPHRPLS